MKFSGIIIKLYDPCILPKKGEEEEFSVDVLIIDEEGLVGIGFYDFLDEEWGFHTDTLVDYNEPGNETKWWWYYPPISKEMITK